MTRGTVIKVTGGEDRAAGYCLGTASNGEHGRGQVVVGLFRWFNCAEVRRRVASSASFYSPIDSTVKVDTLAKREWCATYRVPLNGHTLNR